MIDWLAYFFVKTLGWVCCRLSPATVVWCGARLGTLAYWVQPKRARVGLRNLRAAFGERLSQQEARNILRAGYQQLGAGVVELLRLPVIDQAYSDRYVKVEGMSHFEAAISSGKPVVVLTAHYGNWELASIVAALKGYPVIALARAQRNFPRLYRLLVSYRESKGCKIVHKGGAMRQLLKALEARQPIGIVGDQASRQGIFVNFFGRPALFATGPFELAYTKDAVIVPMFTHRVRGPFHHIQVEPPLKMARQSPKEEAIRQGVEQFASLLMRRITEDPRQWLWMHNRWKYTTARRALVLSDGKLGHLKQSLAVIEALQAAHAQLTHEVVEVQYRSAAHRLIALLWSWWLPGVGASRCLQWTLRPSCSRRLLSQYADVIISCGSSLSAVNLLWSGENRAKSIVMMNPAPLPLGRFDLVIAPRHDQLPHQKRVVQVAGALSRVDEPTLEAARIRLMAHPRFQGVKDSQPVIGVFLGGETSDYAFPVNVAQGIIEQILTACEALDGVCLVTTSRRTSPAVEQLLTQRLGNHPRCCLLLLASQDQLNGTMEGMLGAADVAVVTGESVSMVSEACASGKAVVILEPLPREGHKAATKHHRFLRELVQEGYADTSTGPELSRSIQRALSQRDHRKRLDNFSIVRNAVRALL